MAYNYLNSYIFFGPKTLQFDEEKFQHFINGRTILEADDEQEYTVEEFRELIYQFINYWNTVNAVNHFFCNYAQLPNSEDIVVVIGCECNSMCGCDDISDEVRMAETIYGFDIKAMLGVF